MARTDKTTPRPILVVHATSLIEFCVAQAARDITECLISSRDKRTNRIDPGTFFDIVEPYLSNN